MSRPVEAFARSERLAAMKPGAGRIPSDKPVYRAATSERQALANGMVRWIRKDGGPRSRLHQIIEANACYKDRKKTPTSHQTRANLHTGLGRLFDVLLQAYPLEDPANLDGRHLQYLHDWMEHRWRNGREGKKPSLMPGTIDAYVSYLRHFCRWIGQPDLLERAGVGFTEKGVTTRSQAAKEDKSWEGQGIDIGAKIDEAWQIEPWVAVALLCEHSFGLRRKEALCLRPARDWDPATGLLTVREGAKGGRIRDVVLFEPWQYDVLAAVQEWLREEKRPNGYIAGPDRTLLANIRRYKYVLGEKLGITREAAGTTGHGLRAGFACRLLETLGVTPPVRGGDVGGLPPEVVARAYTITTENMGHGRRRIVSAYAGAISQPAKPAPQQPIQPLPAPCAVPDMAGVLERVRERLAARRAIEEAVRALNQRGGHPPARRTPRRRPTGDAGQGAPAFE